MCQRCPRIGVNDVPGQYHQTLKDIVDNRYVQTVVGSLIGFFLGKTQNDKKATDEQLREKREKVYRPLIDQLFQLRKYLDGTEFPVISNQEKLLMNCVLENKHLLTWFMQNWLNEEKVYLSRLEGLKETLIVGASNIFEQECVERNVSPRKLEYKHVAQILTDGTNPVLLHDNGVGNLSDEKVVSEIILSTKTKVLTSVELTEYRKCLEKYRVYLRDMDEVVRQCESQILRKINRVYYL